MGVVTELAGVGRASHLNSPRRAVPMGLWDKQIQGHATTTSIRNAAELAAGLADVPDAVHEIAERVAHALQHIVGLLDRCDARLLTPGMLDAPLSAARTLDAELQSFE